MITGNGNKNSANETVLGNGTLELTLTELEDKCIGDIKNLEEDEVQSNNQN